MVPEPLPVRLRGTLVPVGASFGVSWFRTLCGFVRTPDDSILLQAIEDKGQTLKPLGLGTIKTQIVDLYHAREHLWELARKLHPMMQ
jgi:hypothetical protein